MSQPASRFPSFVVLTENAQMGWHWFHGARAGLLYGMWRRLALPPTPTWKLHRARQALQPSCQHLTRWSTMLDSYHMVNLSPLRWSPTANQEECFSVLERAGQTIGGDDRGCPSIFVFVPTDFRCVATI